MLQKRVLALVISVGIVVVVATAILATLGIQRARRASRFYLAVGFDDSDRLLSLFESLPSFPDAQDRTIKLELTDRSVSKIDAQLTEGGLEAERIAFIAVDPYVLLHTESSGDSPTRESGARIEQLVAWLRKLDRDRWTPLVIAGDVERDFAAFVLYLAGELLAGDALESLFELIQRPDGEVTTESIEGAVGALEPVIETISNWRDEEILPNNWTDWDSIAVDSAVRDGNAAIAFVERSYVKNLGFEDRLELSLHRPPSGEAKRDFRLVVRAAEFLPGGGLRSDLRESVLELLLGAGFQESIEATSEWSPVSIGETSINREHREIVRWIVGAGDIVAIDRAVFEHSLFERLHILFR